MGTSTNEHTGSRMASKPSTDKYRDNWDSIFNKKKKEEAKPEALDQPVESEN